MQLISNIFEINSPQKAYKLNKFNSISKKNYSIIDLKPKNINYSTLLLNYVSNNSYIHDIIIRLFHDIKIDELQIDCDIVIYNSEYQALDNQTLFSLRSTQPNKSFKFVFKENFNLSKNEIKFKIYKSLKECDSEVKFNQNTLLFLKNEPKIQFNQGQYNQNSIKLDSEYELSLNKLNKKLNNKIFNIQKSNNDYIKSLDELVKKLYDQTSLTQESYKMDNSPSKKLRKLDLIEQSYTQEIMDLNFEKVIHNIKIIQDVVDSIFTGQENIYSSKVINYQEKLEEFINQINQMTDDNYKLKCINEENKIKINQTHNEKSIILDHNQKLSDKLNSMMSKTKENEEFYNKLKVENDNLKYELNQKDKELNYLKQLKDYIDKSKQEHENVIEEQESKIYNLESDIMQLKSYKDQNKNLENIIHQLQSKTNRFKQDQKQTQEKLYKNNQVNNQMYENIFVEQFNNNKYNQDSCKELRNIDKILHSEYNSIENSDKKLKSFSNLVTIDNLKQNSNGSTDIQQKNNIYEEDNQEKSFKSESKAIDPKEFYDFADNNRISKMLCDNPEFCQIQFENKDIDNLVNQIRENSDTLQVDKLNIRQYNIKSQSRFDFSEQNTKLAESSIFENNTELLTKSLTQNDRDIFNSKIIQMCKHKKLKINIIDGKNNKISGQILFEEDLIQIGNSSHNLSETQMSWSIPENKLTVYMQKFQSTSHFVDELQIIFEDAENNENIAIIVSNFIGNHIRNQFIHIKDKIRLTLNDNEQSD